MYFNTLVEEVFTSEKPMEVISNASSFLADIRGTDGQEQQAVVKAQTISVHYLNRRTTWIAKRRSKKLKKLEEEHNYLDRKGDTTYQR